MAQKRRSRDQWRQLVRGWPGSGVTQRAYCDRYGISVASLVRWRKIIRGESGIEPEHGGAVQLVPVDLIDETSEPPGVLTLELADDIRIRIGRHFDAPTLRRLLAVLREAA